MNKFLAKRNLKTQNENVKIWGEKQSQYSPFNSKTTEWVELVKAMKFFITATDCCRHEDDHKHTQREKYTIGVTTENF